MIYRAFDDEYAHYSCHRRARQRRRHLMILLLCSFERRQAFLYRRHQKRTPRRSGRPAAALNAANASARITLTMRYRHAVS